MLVTWMSTEFDLQVVHLLKSFLNLGPRAVECYRSRATLIRHCMINRH